MRKLILPKSSLDTNSLTGAVISSLTTVTGLTNGVQYAAINLDEFATFTPVAADNTPPVPTSGAVENASPSVIRVTFSEILDVTATLQAANFSVSGHSIASVMFANSTAIDIVVSPAVLQNETVTVSYTQPVNANNRIKDLAGNSAVSFSNQAITNFVIALLRIASPYNRTATEIVAASTTEKVLAFRLFRPIGSAHKKSLAVLVENWLFDTATTTAGPGGSVKVEQGITLEINGVSVQLTFGGNALPTFTNGQYGIESDRLFPSQFGLTQFSWGLTVRIRGALRASIGSGIPVAGALDLNDICRSYDPAVASCNNITGTGVLTFTGTTASSTVPAIFLIGEDVNTSADAPCYGFPTDSLGWQSSTQSFCMAALEGSNVANQLLSGIIIGRSGGSGLAFSLDTGRITHLAKYVNRVVSTVGTNDVNSTTVATMVNRERTSWANWRSHAVVHPLARALQIGRTPLFMKITPPGAAANAALPLSDQIVSDPVWDAGGKAEQFTDAMAAQVGIAGGVDKFFGNIITIPNLMKGSASGKGVAGSDNYKFKPGTASDGIHWNAAGASGVNGVGANTRVELIAWG